MKENRMIAKPSQFHTILFSKDREDTTAGTQIKLKGQEIVSKSRVALLGISIDNRLSLEAHMSTLCKKAALKLNALNRLAIFFKFLQRKVLAQSCSVKR